MTLRTNWRIMTLVLAAATLTIFIAANAHLLYVALRSQPECVPHEKEAGSSMRAATPSC